MNESLSDGLLSRFSDFIADRTALYFPRERWSDLESKTRSAAKGFGFTEAEAFINWLVTSPLTTEQIEILAGYLTISETYFWREPHVFDALVEYILPELIRTRENGNRRLRIWSAGCATGEEPYSIAIALTRVIPDIDNWHITILASDINPRILSRAKAGVYGHWSFRNSPLWLKEKYFHRTDDDKFKIIPMIRKMVNFSYLNLAVDTFPSPLNNTNAMDIVFCRNVLMYFAAERAGRIGQNFYHTLVAGGWLMVGASELSQILFSQFESVHFTDAIVYRKNEIKARPFRGVPVDEASDQKEFIQPFIESFVETGQEALTAPYPLSDTSQVSENAERQQRVNKEALDSDAKVYESEAADKRKNVETDVALSVRTLANQGKLAEALSLCDQAIAADKIDPALYYLYAMILQEQNRQDEAIASLKRALYLDPNFVVAHFALGNLALRHGKAKPAKKYFENVLTLLNGYRQEEMLPESDGLTAGRLKEIIHVTMQTGVQA
jgi:chemotaxis protein methyltransferase CheR